MDDFAPLTKAQYRQMPAGEKMDSHLAVHVLKYKVRHKQTIIKGKDPEYVWTAPDVITIQNDASFPTEGDVLFQPPLFSQDSSLSSNITHALFKRFGTMPSEVRVPDPNPNNEYTVTVHGHEVTGFPHLALCQAALIACTGQEIVEESVDSAE